jgi:hypothetical protein
MTTPHNGPIKPDNLEVGPEIIMSDFERSRRAEGRIWAEGYKRHELDLAQETFGLTFPHDLIALFLERRPVRGWNWRSDGEHIRRMLAWPLRGLLFDVEQNDLWWPQWGERPDTAETRAEVLRDVVNQAPKMVPLVSHRYLPCEPNESGNPVFSIHQSDVIYYGADLADYFEREFGNARGPIVGPVKRIRFWSELVESD